MVKVNSVRGRTPHDTRMKILNFLDAGGFVEEERSRVFSDGERRIIVFFDEPSREYRYTEITQKDASYGVDDISSQ